MYSLNSKFLYLGIGERRRELVRDRVRQKGAETKRERLASGNKHSLNE